AADDDPAVVADPDRAEHAPRRAAMGGAPGGPPIGGEERRRDRLAGGGLDRLAVHGESERGPAGGALRDPTRRRLHAAPPDHGASGAAMKDRSRVGARAEPPTSVMR